MKTISLTALISLGVLWSLTAVAAPERAAPLALRPEVLKTMPLE